MVKLFQHLQHFQHFQHQSGAFTMELALVSLVIFSFMTFTSEIIIRQAVHGLLQNLSFSGVSLIKERTQLYDSSTTLSYDQADQLFVILSRSMSRSLAGFDESALGMTIEQVVFTENNRQWPSLAIYQKGQSCSLKGKRLLQEDQLFFLTERANPASLYRVTLCYRNNNRSLTSGFSGMESLGSSSIMIGR